MPQIIIFFPLLKIKTKNDILLIIRKMAAIIIRGNVMKKTFKIIGAVVS